jgi:hypothetical protein
VKGDFEISAGEEVVIEIRIKDAFGFPIENQFECNFLDSYVTIEGKKFKNFAHPSAT